jgi:hypothetical protein
MTADENRRMTTTEREVILETVRSRLIAASERRARRRLMWRKN